MKIHGLQKMTLLDFPGRVACTVFLGGCDFRCPFCHNFELVDGSAPAIMEDTELLSFLEKRRGLLDGVAITGGEPCLYKDLPELLRKIRAMGYGIKLDTNGNHPQLLKSILEEGLVDYVAMDVKNSPEKYAATIGLKELDLTNIRQSLGLLREHWEKHKDTFDYELRTTVINEFHEAADIEKMGEFIKGAPHYFLQCFTDRDSVPFEGFHAASREKMAAYLEIAKRFVPKSEIRGMD